jgi:hypothetical protein
MKTRRIWVLWLVTMLIGCWPIAQARAQEAADGGAPASPALSSSDAGAPGAPSDAAISTATASPAPPTVAPAPAPVAAAPATQVVAQKKVKRAKPLQTSVGMAPTATDFGSEADVVSTSDEPFDPPKQTKWTYTMRGFLRAPMLVGIGPRYNGADANEFHAPPRIPGGTSDDWNYVGLAPSSTASLYLNIQNANVSANVILAANTLYDSGYKDLDQMGGFSQAYVTLKAPNLFGDAGGIAWTVGSFSNRYGTAGPNQYSSGYYGTYLFGRTHVAGEALSADIDLSPDVELILEHGLGAKLEVVPFVLKNPPVYPYLPDQGPVPQGSNYVHHAHAALVVADTVRIGAHYITSWTPNDYADLNSGPDLEGRMTVLGGDVHVDGPVIGNAYLGYSHIKASNIMPLADGIQVLHAANGAGFTTNYFGPINPQAPFTDRRDSGTVDSVLGQYILHFAPLVGGITKGPDATLAVFGMLNHVKAPTFTTDKMKLGTELQVAPIRYISIGGRFDRVLPDGSNNTAVGYSAISPRVIVHTNYLSREYVVIDYTHFVLGSNARASAPYNGYPKPDPNLFSITALMSF